MWYDTIPRMYLRCTLLSNCSKKIERERAKENRERESKRAQEIVRLGEEREKRQGDRERKRE